MSGFYGIVGSLPSGPDAMTQPLRWTGEEAVDAHRAGDLQITTAVLPEGVDGAHVDREGGRWWVIGRIYGQRRQDDYVPANRPRAEMLAPYIEAYGLDGLQDVNGKFAAVHHHPDGRVSLVTDRAGSVPIYYVAGDDWLAFSTHIQALLRHPQLAPSFDVASLTEYCTIGRVTGLATPFAGIRTVPPSGWMTVESDGSIIDRRSYWAPRYDASGRSFSSARDRYADLLDTLCREHLDPEKRYGLLLSGGSDSRLLLDLMLEHVDADRIVAYHLADWLSEEARIAERVALTAGVDFQLLRRDEEYHRGTLERVGPRMNYYGRFEQAHTALITERLREEVDEVVSGLYADTWFRAGPVPRYAMGLGSIGTVHLPLAKPCRSVEEYLSRYPDRSPAYLRHSRSAREILRSRLRRTPDGRIVDHGVAYPSPVELCRYVDVYPLWNDPDSFYATLTNTVPAWTPFLDDRVVDLALGIPHRYQEWGNLSNAVLRVRNSALADIPHAATGYRCVGDSSPTSPGAKSPDCAAISPAIPRRVRNMPIIRGDRSVRCSFTTRFPGNSWRRCNGPSRRSPNSTGKACSTNSVRISRVRRAVASCTPC